MTNLNTITKAILWLSEPSIFWTWNSHNSNFISSFLDAKATANFWLIKVCSGIESSSCSLTRQRLGGLWIRRLNKDPRPDRISLDGQTGPIGFCRKLFPFFLFLTWDGNFLKKWWNAVRRKEISWESAEKFRQLKPFRLALLRELVFNTQMSVENMLPVTWLKQIASYILCNMNCRLQGVIKLKTYFLMVNC